MRYQGIMKTVLILLISCLSFATYGQHDVKSPNKDAQRLYEQANQLLSSKQYERAAELLEKSVTIDKQFIIAYQQLGDIYRKLQQYPDAKKNYQKVLEINPDFHSLTIFGLAESEFYTGNYSSALVLFNKYLLIPNLNDASKKTVAKYIADCEFSINAMKKPVAFSPKNLGPEVNSPDDEYFPTVTADEINLIFTRRAKNQEDFYRSKKDGVNWGKAAYLSPSINSNQFNEGAQCISPDGMYLFFTGCNRPDGLGKCDIYVCKKEGKEWSKPFNIGPPVNSNGWESQPSISADGHTLYFVSSMPGGQGGTDIWKSTLQEGGSWSKPVNLGPKVNTARNEQSPFIHADGKTLYFASEGWPGLGRSDVFISRLDDAGNWKEAENLGFPINTAGEESGLSISTDGRTAYFSSNMPGGQGKMDIYSFELPVNVKPGKVTYVKGTIQDAKTKEPVEAGVRITELKTNSLAYDDASNPESGEFLATMPAGKKYALTIDKPGYLFHSENFALTENKSLAEPFILNIALHKIETGGSVNLKNIFFETNKAELLPESKAELQQLISFLKSNPTVSIEIDGHTDNVGDEKQNQLLSENRAKSVYNYLVSNKINISRLSFKGFGESKPISQNTTDEGRQKNRRTEFRVVKL